MKRFRLAFQLVCALVLGLFLSVNGAFATDPTLPDAGVDVAGLTTSAITKLGTYAVVAVGGFFAFLAIRKGLSLASSDGVRMVAG